MSEDNMSDSVALKDCPIGLFVSVEGNELCLKTEYGNNEGRVDAYIVSSGEFFWGSAPQTIPNQRAQMVRPVDVDIVPMTRCTACAGDGSDDEGENCLTCHGHGWVRAERETAPSLPSLAPKDGVKDDCQ
jgi:hypothetical protein